MERKSLWDSLLDVQTIASNISWMVGGEFKVITEAGERIGNHHFNFEVSLDFNNFIASASLLDIGYFGSKYT